MSDYQSKFTGEEIDAILEDAKNKPFGDNLPVTERFSQAETPNPVSFESAELGMTAYKVFDFIPTTEQVMQGVTVKTNGVEENLLSGTMQSLGEVAVLFTMPSGYMYAGFAQAGELVINPTYGITVNAPEAGGYFLLPYGTPLPEGLTIEISYIGTKKIDPKYLPDGYGNSPDNSGGGSTNTGGVKTIEYILDVSTGEIIFNTDEIEAAINSGEYFILNLITKAPWGDFPVYFQYNGSDCDFYTFMDNGIAVIEYDRTIHEFTTIKKYDLISLKQEEETASTYSLRNNTPTFAEQVIAWAQKRGLINQ